MNKKIILMTPLVAILLSAAQKPAADAVQTPKLPPPPVAIAVDPRVVLLQEAALKDETAYSIVDDLTTEIGARRAGTDQEARARAWAVKKLLALGFRNVHVEPFNVPIWQRGDEHAEVVSPFKQKLSIVGLGNSSATSKAGLILPITHFFGLSALQQAPAGSLKGQIAFVSAPVERTQDGSGYFSSGMLRLLGPGIAAEKGAEAILMQSIGTDNGRSAHTGVTLFPDGVDPIPSAALAVADAQNLERMVKRGKPIQVHIVLDGARTLLLPSGNIVAEVTGTDPSAGIILIGAHLDSWDISPGATDDGAGVAIVVAAARLMAQNGPHRRTIRVVLYGDEESGGIGGAIYQERHINEPIVFVAESDSGADRVWRFNAKMSHEAKPVTDRLAASLARLGVLRGEQSAEGGPDVGPFVEIGVQSVDLGESMLRYFDFQHSAEDTLDKIDPDQLQQNVAAWVTMLEVLADAPEHVAKIDKAE